MRLETERLTLRSCTMDDVDELHALWTDAGVRKYLWDDAVIDRETVMEVVQASEEDWADHGIGLFCAVLRNDDGIIGFCGVRRYPPDEEWELLYGFLPSYWGQGLAVEASRAVLGLAFEKLPVKRIAGRTDPPNRASVRVLEKLGMRFEGRSSAEGMESLCYCIDRAV